MRHSRASTDPNALAESFAARERRGRQARYSTPFASGTLKRGQTWIGPMADSLIGQGPDGGFGVYVTYQGLVLNVANIAAQHKATLDSQQSTLTYHGELLVWAQAELSNQAGHIITLQGTVASQGSTIASQGSRISDLESEVGSLNSQLSSANGGLAGLASTVAGHEESIRVLRLRVTALENAGGGPGGNPTIP